MKILAEEFMGKGEVRGIIFMQVFRHNDICIYFRSDGHFEVIRIRTQKECSRVMFGKTVNYYQKEIYPKGGKWGPHDKCCRDLASAVNAFNFSVFSLGYAFRLDMKTPQIASFNYP